MRYGGCNAALPCGRCVQKSESLCRWPRLSEPCGRTSPFRPADGLPPLNYPIRHMTWDDRRPIVKAGSDFIVDAALVAFRPTRFQRIRLKFQNACEFAGPTLVAMPIGDNRRELTRPTV